MNRTVGAGLLAAVLLGGVAPGAMAEWVRFRITPKDLSQQEMSLTVATRKAAGEVQFDVTLGPKRRAISPFTSMDLYLIDGKRAQKRTVPVHWMDGRATGSFRVPVAALDRSRLEIREQGYEQARDEDGNPLTGPRGKTQYRMTLGGIAYWFRLRDFAQPWGAAPKGPQLEQ